MKDKDKQRAVNKRWTQLTLNERKEQIKPANEARREFARRRRMLLIKIRRDHN